MGEERYDLWLTGFGHGLSHAWELIFPVFAAKNALDFDAPVEAFIRWSFWLHLPIDRRVVDSRCGERRG
jgi:hypothetical protein